jgi:SAM-dependent methyltransferase
MQNQSNENCYVLGHSSKELDRLIEQSRLFGELTEQLFFRAGLTSGMKVLDIGCGAGDISFLASRMVGPSGKVIGIDRSEDAIAKTRSRASAAGVENVTFMRQDLESLSLEEKLDALVGRLVLMYFPDPGKTLRHLCQYIHPGGIICFQEGVFTGLRAIPESPLFSRTIGWMLETVKAGNANIEMGLNLNQTFLEAGLPAPEMMLGARIENSSKPDVFEYIANTFRSLLPMTEKFKIASAQEVGIDTLAERLQEEVQKNSGIVILPHLVGAWSRLTS